MIDETHDVKRKSWVTSANEGSDFPVQNLPIGVFSAAGHAPRGGVAIGSSIVDLHALVRTGLLAGDALRGAELASASTLNEFLGAKSAVRLALRKRLSELLAEGCRDQASVSECLLQAADCTMHLPARIGDYTDFYVGINHARNVGKQFRPDNPLLPNYKYLPIGYHGRSSSICISGTDVVRPSGQTKPPDANEPAFGPSRRLDYELELGVWVGAGNPLGSSIKIGDAPDHISGYCLLNDWSARDIQAWEYQPLGPFLAKNFASTISPWVITQEAIEPYRIAVPGRPAGDAPPLSYLDDRTDQGRGAFNISLEVAIRSEKMRSAGQPAMQISMSNTKHMYWTVAQMIAHHTSNGCNLRSGDLLGTGTISGPTPDSYGSILELTRGGAEPIALPSGEQRRFVEDGDEIIFRAKAKREGFATIGFGESRAKVLAALAD